MFRHGGESMGELVNLLSGSDVDASSVGCDLWYACRIADLLRGSVFLNGAGRLWFGLDTVVCEAPTGRFQSCADSRRRSRVSADYVCFGNVLNPGIQGCSWSCGRHGMVNQGKELEGDR